MRTSFPSIGSSGAARGDGFALIGADGCRSGWVCAIQTNVEAVEIEVFPSFAALVATWPRAVVAIDVPIGLTSAGPRDCDRLARARLGPRRSSVFPAPLRCSLRARDQAEASRLQRMQDGRGLSAQAWNIVAKIREVDDAITPAMQCQIFETHPELDFAAMNGGQPMRYSKKTREGKSEREALLTGRLSAMAHSRPAGAQVDDVLDALAALWTAGRLVAGAACRLPEAPALDERGLRMEIWF